MFFFKRKKKKKQYPSIDVTIQDVRNAVVTYSDSLAKGVFTTIIVNEDNSIDFDQLAPILGGIPTKNYYMSKETFDIFEEVDKEIPVILDKVQRAVDGYVKKEKHPPVIKFDPDFRVNYHLLMQEGYLDFRPNIPLYIHKDGMITHIKPER